MFTILVALTWNCPSCPPPFASMRMFRPFNIILPSSASITTSPFLHFIILAGNWDISPGSLTFKPSPRISIEHPGVYKIALPVPGPSPSDPWPVPEWNAKDCASCVWISYKVSPCILLCPLWIQYLNLQSLSKFSLSFGSFDILLMNTIYHCDYSCLW